MSGPAAPPKSFATRVVVGLVILVIVWIVLGQLLGFVYALIRAALFVGLFAVVAWIVLVGPPSRPE
jgi:hypothetical protein